MSLRKSSHSACLAAQQDVDRQLECASEDTRRSLLSKRNEFAFINTRFPPEVFSNIFHALRNVAAEDVFPRNQTRWIEVTHVCQHWRRIALDFPSLWIRIIFTSPEMANMMLQRSRSLPVVIQHCDDSGWRRYAVPVAALDQVLAQAIGRAREINMSSSKGPLFNGLTPRPHLRQPAPFLEDFTWCPSSGMGVYNDLPDNLFTGHAPRLRAIHLEGVLISPTPVVLVNLTDLSLSLNCLRPSLSLQELLKPMQGLRRLSLDRVVGRNMVDSVLLQDHIVNLPHLKHMTVKDSTPVCAQITRHIIPHPSAQLYLACTAERPEDCAIADALPARYITAIADSHPLHNLSVSFFPEEVVVSGATQAGQGCVPSEESSFQLTFLPSHILADSYYDGSASFRGVLQKADLDEVRVLSLRGLPLADDASVAETARLLGQLSGVEELHLCWKRTIAPILQILHPPLGVRPAFALLRRLHITDMQQKPHDLASFVARHLVGRAGTRQVAQLDELTFNGHAVPSQYLQDLETLETWHPVDKDALLRNESAPTPKFRNDRS